MSSTFAAKEEISNAYFAMKKSGGTAADWNGMMIKAIAAMRFFANTERAIATKAGINAGHGAAASQIDMCRLFWGIADMIRANSLLARNKAEDMEKLAA